MFLSMARAMGKTLVIYNSMNFKYRYIVTENEFLNVALLNIAL